MGRLLQQQGKHDQARRLLAEICDWFSEGFDTADLQEAKALLEDLAGRPKSPTKGKPSWVPSLSCSSRSSCR